MVSDDFSCVQLGLLFRVRLAKVLPHTHSAHATLTATAAGCSRHIVAKTRKKNTSSCRRKTLIPRSY